MKATTQRTEPARASSYRLPHGETEQDRRVQVNPSFLTPIHAVETNDAGECINVELGELPLGTRELYMQHRMCGDFYCFIHGARQVAAIGDTPTNAFKSALRLAA